MDRISVMIAISILVLSILPFASANPVPVLDWSDAQAGGSPEPYPKNTNVIFFKEIVKADIGDYRVKVHADYWFRNERNQTETIRILLPLSKDPRGMDLKLVDINTGSNQTLDFFECYTKILGYKSISFEMSLTNYDEVKVSVEFWDDLYRYDRSDSDHVSYYFSYLVGSARSWNRNIENASFEYRIPISNYDSGHWDGWNRTTNGSDYVFTKNYSDWLPDPEYDFETLMWRKNKPHQAEGWNNPTGTIIVIVAIASMVLFLAGIISFILSIIRRKKEKLIHHAQTKSKGDGA